MSPRDLDDTFEKKKALFATYVDEFLQVVVQICQILSPLFVLSNKLLLPLQQLLALLFKGLSLDALIFYTCCHQAILVVGFGILGVFGEELLHRGKWELLVLVAV